jgi:hypothetical protein
MGARTHASPHGHIPTQVLCFKSDVALALQAIVHIPF